MYTENSAHNYYQKVKQRAMIISANGGNSGDQNNECEAEDTSSNVEEVEIAQITSSAMGFRRD